MAKKWYPVIDILSCAECGTCVNFCPHGVYDKKRSPIPVVTNPDACIDHCHGCGNQCPHGAISYVGDDTGWTPPHGERVQQAEPCCCGHSEHSEKSVKIEYLYLDLTTCNRCIGTDQALDEVVEQLRPVLELAGFSVEYRKTEITTPELAIQYRFLSSPTILVNGKDICPTVTESACGCCSEISGTDVNCRVFEYEGKSYEVAPKEMLAKEILKAVFSESNACFCGGYELPDNLKSFFDGKEQKTKSDSCRCDSMKSGCC